MTNFDLLPPETLAEAENAWRRAQEKEKHSIPLIGRLELLHS